MDRTALLTFDTDAIDTVTKLVEFIRLLRKDLENHPDKWANLTLDDYLESMEALLTARYLNENLPSIDYENLIFPDKGQMCFLANVLSGASIYE